MYNNAAPVPRNQVPLQKVVIDMCSGVPAFFPEIGLLGDIGTKELLDTPNLN